MLPFFTERRPSQLLKSGKRPWKCPRGKTEISGGKLCVYVNHRLLLVIYVSTKPCLKAKINDFSKQTLEHGKDIRHSNLISQSWHAKIRNFKQRRKIHWHSSQLAKRRRSISEKSGINMWTVTIWFAVETVFFQWDLSDAAYYESEINFLQIFINCWMKSWERPQNTRLSIIISNMWSNIVSFRLTLHPWTLNF